MPAPIPPYLALSTIAIEQPLYWDTLTVVCPPIHDVVYRKRFLVATCKTRLATRSENPNLCLACE